MLDAAKEWCRSWFAKIWKVRGGGLYAVGWAVTFAWLEVTTIIGEIFEAEGVVDFLTSQLVEFVLRFLSDSLVNMIQAFIWPVHVIQWQMPVGVIMLGIAYVAFPILVKPHLTAWLFPDGDPAELEGPDGDGGAR